MGHQEELSVGTGIARTEIDQILCVNHVFSALKFAWPRRLSEVSIHLWIVISDMLHKLKSAMSIVDKATSNEVNLPLRNLSAQPAIITRQPMWRCLIEF